MVVDAAECLREAPCSPEKRLIGDCIFTQNVILYQEHFKDVKMHFR